MKIEAYRKYMEEEIYLNHPIENIILIYKMCINKFRLIKNLYKECKYRKADEELETLENAILELKMQVNEKGDKTISENLNRIYDFVLEKIYAIRQFRTTEPVEAIIKILTNLMEGYEEALKHEKP